MNQNNNIAFEHIQWMISVISPAFVGLMALVWYLLKELIKAKDSEVDVTREIVPLTEKLIDSTDILNAIIKSNNTKG